MKMVFMGSIPSKKNSRIQTRTSNFPSKNYVKFEKSIKEQVHKNYYQWFELVKKLDKPLCFVVNIYKYENRGFDFDNKISSIQDVLFHYKPRKKEFNCFELDDDYRNVKFYPGKVVIDKDTLKSKDDDWFELILVKEVQEFTELC
jgi:hypothetical protein